MKSYNNIQKLFLISTICTLIFCTLTACVSRNESQGTKVTPKSNSSNSSTTTDTVSSNLYDSIIHNGRYQVSAQRGVSVSNTNNMSDLMGFESGLLNYERKIFSPEKYIFQEGQNISKELAISWLGRKSKDNPQGLNPVDNGSKDPNKRNPLVLQQILEHDFVTKKGNGYNLEGIVIGLSINSTDYYQKEQYGPTFKTDIKNSAGDKYAKESANIILTRLRKIQSLKNVPIYLYVYREGEEDSLVGGNFIFSSKADQGDKFTNWTNINEKNVVYPVTNNDLPVSQKDSDDFNNFKNNIQNFFPNIAGVIAQAHYESGLIKGMVIKITTQFYSITEISSFTQYCANQANQNLPKGIPLEIDIQSANGTMLSFISRNPTDTGFYTHVFSSY